MNCRRMEMFLASVIFALTIGPVAVSGLTCQQCALAEVTTADADLTNEINDGELNQRTDAGCATWGADIQATVACSPNDVKYGKDLATGSEGTDFIYRCATIEVTYQYDYSFRTTTGSDLKMATSERGCVAVPPDNAYTMDACFDFASNIVLMKAIADLHISISYASQLQGLASTTPGDNVVCFCTADTCNSVHTSDGQHVVVGPLTPQTTAAGDDGNRGPGAAMASYVVLLAGLIGAGVLI